MMTLGRPFMNFYPESFIIPVLLMQRGRYDDSAVTFN
jgi:hypothetical protein